MIGIAFAVLVFGALISVIYGQKAGQGFINGCLNLVLVLVIVIAGAIAYAYGYGLIVGLIVIGLVVLVFAWHTLKYWREEGSLKTGASSKEKHASIFALCFLGVLTVVLCGLWKIGVNSLAPSPLDTFYRPTDTATGGGYASYGNKSFGFTSEIANPTTCVSYGIPYTGNSLWVQSVVAGSPAQRAKLPTGVIVEVDGYAPDSQVLTAVKARHNVGDWIAFKIVTPDRRWWSYWVQLGSS